MTALTLIHPYLTMFSTHFSPRISHWQGAGLSTSESREEGSCNCFREATGMKLISRLRQVKGKSASWLSCRCHPHSHVTNITGPGGERIFNPEIWKNQERPGELENSKDLRSLLGGWSLLSKDHGHPTPPTKAFVACWALQGLRADPPNHCPERKEIEWWENRHKICMLQREHHKQISLWPFQLAAFSWQWL